MCKLMKVTAMAAILAGPAIAEDGEYGILMIDTSNGDCMIANPDGQVRLVDGTCEEYKNSQVGDNPDAGSIFSQPNEPSSTS